MISIDHHDEKCVSCLKTVIPIFNVNKSILKVVPPSHYLSHTHFTQLSIAKIENLLKTQINGSWGSRCSDCLHRESRSKNTSRKAFWGSRDWINLLQQTKCKFSLMYVAHLLHNSIHIKKFSWRNIYGLQHVLLLIWICSFYSLLSYSSSAFIIPLWAGWEAISNLNGRYNYHKAPNSKQWSYKNNANSRGKNGVWILFAYSSSKTILLPPHLLCIGLKHQNTLWT